MINRQLQGDKPNPNDEMWVEIGRDLTKKTIDQADESCKNLLIGIGVLFGLFSAISSDTMRKQVQALANSWVIGSYIVAILFSAPLLLWLGSAVAAAKAIGVESYRLQLGPLYGMEGKMIEVASAKYKWMRRSIILLIIGLVILTIDLYHYLAF